MLKTIVTLLEDLHSILLFHVKLVAPLTNCDTQPQLRIYLCRGR